MEREVSDNENLKSPKNNKLSFKRLTAYLGIPICTIIAVIIFNNRGGYFVVEICDDSGNSCFNKEARVDPQWSSPILVTVKSKSVIRDQKDRDIIITYSCQELGKLGACKGQNSEFTYSIRKIQRL